MFWKPGNSVCRAQKAGRGAPPADANWTQIFDAEEAAPTIDGQVIGTPPYMPPEQAGGCIERLDERSDIYSLGAMLYEFLGGRAPYVREGGPLTTPPSQPPLPH